MSYKPYGTLEGRLLAIFHGLTALLEGELPEASMRLCWSPR